MANYSYPIDEDWTHEEIANVINFLNLVEAANETGVETEKFLAGYTKFKSVIKSIGEEKRIGREFEKASGYSLYRTVQQAKKTTGKRFKQQ
ncbi:hypothetical protein CF160_04755 [Enterococcus pseudoavium]|nr:hypothetical protein CF160_04755 [Enterococcus pseudoavium]